jgi:predicted CopG family antitoxin
LTTKTITITKNAYEALAREKRRDESFSDVALRLTAKKGELKDCLGSWKLNKEERKLFGHIKKSWKRSDREFKKRAGKL